MKILYTKWLRIFFDRGYPKNGFVFKIHFGRGAGYTWGRTLYVAYNSGSRRWKKQFRSINEPLIQIGFTQNCNKIPYMSH